MTTTKPKTAYIPPHRRKQQNVDLISEPQSISSSQSFVRRQEESSTPRSDDILSGKSGGDHAMINEERRGRHRQDLLPRFTRICCINLRKREDRWKTFRSRLRSALRLDDNDGVTGARGGEGGKSHRRRDVDNYDNVIGHDAEAARDFFYKVERFEAVDGAVVMTKLSERSKNSASHDDNDEGDDIYDDDEIPRLEWDATKNSLYDRHIQPPCTKTMTAGEVGCAMSHVRLWKQLLVNDDERDFTMLILEDDATLYERKGQRIGNGGNSSSKKLTYTHHRGGDGHHHNQSCRTSHAENSEDNTRYHADFIDAMSAAWKILPSDWDILYLGFSDRGERNYIVQPDTIAEGDDDGVHGDVHGQKKMNTIIRRVKLFRPTYGFHTHAYVLRSRSASFLVSNLPVNGPLDVWLADNNWFGLNVYCAIVDGEGWKGQGANLISQRKHDTQSDIRQSGRYKTERVVV